MYQFSWIDFQALGEKMSFTRSALLTAGVVLAASLISNAAQNPARTSAEDEATKAKPAVTVHKSAAKTTKADADSEDTDARSSDGGVVSAGSDAAVTAQPNAAPSASPVPSFGTLSAPAVTIPAGPVAPKAAVASPRSSLLSASPVSPVKPVKPLSSDPVPASSDSPNTTITPTGLAVTDSVLSYCAQVDRLGASTYQAAVSVVTQGHDAGEISAVRMDPDYVKTQTTIKAQLASISFGNGLFACRQFVGGTHKPFGIATPIHSQQFGSF